MSGRVHNEIMAALKETDLLVALGERLAVSTTQGFTFPQALKIATLNGATYLGRDKEIGSLAIGKRADIAVVEGDPAADAKAIERMPLVFKAGVGYRTQAIFDGLKGAIGLY